MLNHNRFLTSNNKGGSQAQEITLLGIKSAFTSGSAFIDVSGNAATWLNTIQDATNSVDTKVTKDFDNWPLYSKYNFQNEIYDNSDNLQHEFFFDNAVFTWNQNIILPEYNGLCFTDASDNGSFYSRTKFDVPSKSFTTWQIDFTDVDTSNNDMQMHWGLKFNMNVGWGAATDNAIAMKYYNGGSGGGFYFAIYVDTGAPSVLTPHTGWNGDKLDGTGVSGLNLNRHIFNEHYMFGILQETSVHSFYILDPSTNRWVRLHTEDFTPKFTGVWNHRSNGQPYFRTTAPVGGLSGAVWGCSEMNVYVPNTSFISDKTFHYPRSQIMDSSFNIAAGATKVIGGITHQQRVPTVGDKNMFCLDSLEMVANPGSDLLIELVYGDEYDAETVGTFNDIHYYRVFEDVTTPLSSGLVKAVHSKLTDSNIIQLKYDHLDLSKLLQGLQDTVLRTTSERSFLCFRVTNLDTSPVDLTNIIVNYKIK